MEHYLVTRRKELGLTQKEVADYIGVTEATVSRWESGNIANMRRDRIKKYSEVLQTSPAAIMGYPGEGYVDPDYLIDILKHYEKVEKIPDVLGYGLIPVNGDLLFRTKAINSVQDLISLLLEVLHYNDEPSEHYSMVTRALRVLAEIIPVYEKEDLQALISYAEFLEKNTRARQGLSPVGHEYQFEKSDLI